MKANNAFKNNEEAVSPVIGVILMVAITVVLAAVVFVLVSDLGDGAGSDNPQVAFTKDEQGAFAGGILTVASISNGPLSLGTEGTGGAATVTIGGSSSCVWDSVANDGTDNTSGTADDGDMSAGDQILCTGAGTVTISHTTTGTLLYSGSFQ